MRLNWRLMGVAVLAAGLISAGISQPAAADHGRAPARTTAASNASGVGISAARLAFDRMTPAQRIGQLFMVGGPATGVSSATNTAISQYHVGNVILTGRSSAGVTATRSVTAGLQKRATVAATLAVPLFIATDQEGGQVQVLSGPGFSTIPEALTQGGWAASTLQTDAQTWGSQLSSAGVNVNLAPVADTVPVGQDNPPIGGFDREYGHTPSVVGPHATAFAKGMAGAGVAATVKHFPGLGRVDENTDTSSGVTDHVTTRHDTFLTPFHSVIESGVPFVMMSTADYQLIDPGVPAAFSATIIGGMLRGDMGFRGVVISDDLGGAQQVAAWTPGQRAINFINAGGDVVLSVDPSVIPAMVKAVSTEASGNAAFAAKVKAAALTVLQAKQAQGLLRGPDFAADFTGDGKSDVAVWRPSNGTWYVRGQPSVEWGEAQDIPVPGDYTGDGKTDFAVWRPSNGTWYVRGQPSVQWGESTDIPVPGDYTGDRKTDFAVWRPSNGTWYVRGQPSVHWGESTDIPVPGDYTGDGKTELAVWRPSTGTWYVPGQPGVHWGGPQDVPVPADYTGDGKTDLATWRPSTGTWYVRGRSSVRWGESQDIPVPGDFTGAGHAALATWRPSTGTWYERVGSTPVYGVTGDVPL